jgi:REP element-mobilizing transposase RayT
MSYVIALYHIVFSTKDREMTIQDNFCDELYRFCNSLLIDNNCRLLQINGAPDHIHLLINLHSSMSLSDMVKLIKQKTSIWMKASGKFPMFRGWEREYFAHSVSEKDTAAVKHYIMQQKIHHLAFPYDSELRKLVNHVGLTYYEKEVRP